MLKGTINYCVDSFLGKLTSGSVPIGRRRSSSATAALDQLAAPVRCAPAAERLVVVRPALLRVGMDRLLRRFAA